MFLKPQNFIQALSSGGRGVWWYRVILFNNSFLVTPALQSHVAGICPLLRVPRTYSGLVLLPSLFSLTPYLEFLKREMNI